MSSAIVLVSHDRRHAARRCRARRSGSTAARSAGSTAASTPSRRGATRCSSRRSATAKSSTARSRPSSHWLRYGVTARRSRNQGRLRALNAMRQRAARAAPRHRKSEVFRQRRQDVRQAGDRGDGCLESARRAATLIRDFSIRIARGDRLGIVGAERRRQDDAARHPDRRGGARQRQRSARAATSRSLRSTSAAPASTPTTTLKEALTRTGGDNVMVGGEARHVMSYMQDFLFAPEQAGQPVSALSGGERGTADARPRAGDAVEPSGARRADQRPRSRNARSPAGGDRRLSRHGAPRQPRSRFSRPHRHVGAGGGGKRALDRICRRLFRHAGAARRRRSPAGPQAERVRGRQPKTAADAARAFARNESSSFQARSTRSKRCRGEWPSSTPRSPRLANSARRSRAVRARRRGLR